MNSFLWGGGDPGLQRLGWVLIHFLWQGMGIGAVLALSLWLARRVRPTVRYFLLCAGLGACLLAPLATWQVIGNSPARIFHAESAGHPKAQNVEKDVPATPTLAPALPLVSSWDPWRDQVVPTVQAYLPFLVALWLAGIVFLLLRHAVGWFHLRRIVRSGLPIEDKVWMARLDRLRTRMKALPPVCLLQSAWIEVPMLVGWLRPTLLVPASLLTGLPIAQVEAIFAHEIAHIVRHDFLVNLLQVAIETLLFYHPVIWWIGRELRQAREECCDDLAVEALGGHREYVAALASLEERRAEVPAGALSVGGGSLLRRLRRLVIPAKQETGRGRIAGLLVIVGLAAILLLMVRAVVLRGHEGPSLRGVVVDQAGRPVPGAEISFSLMESKPKAPSTRHSGDDYQKIAYADSRGRFVLPDLSPAFLFTVVAAAPGHGPDFAAKIDPTAGKVRLVLPQLPEGAQGAEARGHVVGPDGAPVAGAQIRPHGYTRQSTWSSYGQGEGWPIKATDANGDFALPQTWFDTGMNQGVDGQITATGFAPAMFYLLPYNGQPRRIVLDHGGTVTGRLVDERGRPAPNVEVEAIPASVYGVYEVVATTDAGGRFVFPNLMANEAYRIYGKRSSLPLWGATRAQAVQVGASGSTTDMGNLQVMYGRTVVGRIVLTDHLPVPANSEVQLWWKDRDGGSYFDRFHPGPDGKFEFHALDGEAIQLRASVSGYRYHLPSQKDGVALTVAPDLAEVEIVCEPESRTVEGQVVLSDSKPLSRPILVTVCRVGGNRIGYPVGVDGKFSFSAADGDRFTFEAAIPGYQPSLPKPRANKEDEVVIAPSTQVTFTFEPISEPAPQPPQ